jgi:hypothetical protein
LACWPVTEFGVRIAEEFIMSQAVASISSVASGKVDVVNSVQELVDATGNPAVKTIAVATDLSEIPGIRLAPGVGLRSQTNFRAALRFAEGTDGICLSSDNVVADLDLFASNDRCAIWNDESVSSFGALALRRLKTTGRVRILARGNVLSGHLVVEELDIASADARAEKDRPHEYGVDVLQGAFTLWNMQTDEKIVITADLIDLSAGRFGAPVLGSGIFVSGSGETGGRLEVQHLRTKAVYSDGRIEPGTPGQISGGVFVVHGARVDLVENTGAVTTYGPNDMALDNWGVVDRWISKDKVTTFGPSGVGFVNFGTIGKLQTEAPIETFGQGARGFNVYTGTVRSGDFDRIVTHADGAVGVQISQPVGTLVFRRGIETFGAVGDSLVKGVVMKLAATALSIRPGGSAESIHIQGGLRAHGQDGLALSITAQSHLFTSRAASALVQSRSRRAIARHLRFELDGRNSKGTSLSC